MSNEMNRREAELNEAELKAVSGGADDNFTLKATNFCFPCTRNVHCSHFINGLADYMRKNGAHSVNSESPCPYLNE